MSIRYTGGGNFAFDPISPPLTSFTISGWIQRRSSATGVDWRLALFEPTGGGSQLSVRLNDAGSYEPVFDSGYSSISGTTPAFALGAWHHVVHRQDTGTQTGSLFVDGVLLVTGTSSFSSARDCYGAFGLDAQLYDWILWDSALSDANCIAQFSSLSPVVSAWAWWLFTDSATANDDSSGNGRSLNTFGTADGDSNPTIGGASIGPAPRGDYGVPPRRPRAPDMAASVGLPPLVFPRRLPFIPGDLPVRPRRSREIETTAPPPAIFLRGGQSFMPGDLAPRAPRAPDRDTLIPLPPPVAASAGRLAFVPGDVPPRPPRRPETWTWSVPPPVVVPFALPFSPGELPLRAPRFTDAWAWEPPPAQLGRFGALFFAESPPVPRSRWPDQATWEIPPPLVLSFATSFDPGVMPPRPPRARSADMLTWPPSALAAAPALVSFAFSDLQAMLRARRARPDEQPWIPSALAAQVSLAGFAFAPGDAPSLRMRVTPPEGAVFVATSLPAPWTPGAVLEVPARRARLRSDTDALVLSFPVFGWAPPAVADAPSARSRTRADVDGTSVAVRVAAIWVPSSPADVARARRFLEAAPGAAPLPVPLPILPWTPSADHYVPRRRQRPVWVELDFGPLGSRIFVPGRLVQRRRDGGTHSTRAGSGRTSRRPTK